MSGNIIKMDCGCEVEISKVRISEDDPKYYRGGKIIKFCHKHELPFQQDDMIEEAFRRYDRKKLESTTNGIFVLSTCTFPKCKNIKTCITNGFVCPAMLQIANGSK